jgi:hypothetical protein
MKRDAASWATAAARHKAQTETPGTALHPPSEQRSGRTILNHSPECGNRSLSTAGTPLSMSDGLIGGRRGTSHGKSRN